MLHNATITGWGRWTGGRRVTNHDFPAALETSDEWIRTRSGIAERRFAPDGTNLSDMCAEAGRTALDRAGLAPTDLDLIVVATSSPDHLTPPVSSQVQDKLGATDVGAMTVVVGCTGFVYALVTAQQFLAAGTARRILVVGAELISRNLDMADRSTCVLFGDGAAAVVMEATEQDAGVRSFVLGSDGSGWEHIIQPSGGTAIPTSHAAIEAGQQYLRMNGREVFKFATGILVRALEEALGKAGLTADDLDLVIPHQANARIIEYAAGQLGLRPEQLMVNVDRYGNTSAASIPIALCEALEEGRVGPGSTLALVGFGAGLTWAASIFQMAPVADAAEAPARSASAAVA